MILYISITTLALAFLILYNNYKANKNSILLFGYLFILCIYSLTHYFLFQTKSTIITAILFRHTIPFFYFAGAVLYLYVRGSLKNTWIWSKKDYLHFLAPLTGCINLFPYFVTPFKEKTASIDLFYIELNTRLLPEKTLLYPIYIGSILGNILFGTYILASAILLYKNWQHKSENKKQFKWLLFLVSNSAFLLLCAIALGYTFYINDEIDKTGNSSFIVTLISGVTFCLIPAVMIFFPQVIYKIKEENEIEEIEIEEKKKSINDKSMYILAARIIEHFEIEKPYLKSSFSLDDLAEQLGVPKHQLYTCLNNCINKKFTQLRTNYRIEYAKKLLLMADLDSISLQGVWMSSGFSSKTNFFTTFKEETGLTPSEFIQLEKKQ